MELNDLRFTKKGLTLVWMSLNSASQPQKRAQRKCSQASKAVLVNEPIGSISHLASV